MIVLNEENMVVHISKIFPSFQVLMFYVVGFFLCVFLIGSNTVPLTSKKKIIPSSKMCREQFRHYYYMKHSSTLSYISLLLFIVMFYV